MHPDEEFSQNIGPPWQPPAWSKTSQQLEDEARTDLFQTRAAIESGALGTPKMAMAGQETAPANESERIITPTPTTLAQHWNHALNDMRATEPLYGRSGEVPGTHSEGTANPNA